MRIFELHATDFVSNPNRVMILDLESISIFQKTPYEGRTLWTVTFSSGDSVEFTKAAWDRLLLAWKSR